MNHMNSKRFLGSLLTFTVLSSSLLPAAAFAQNNKAASNTKETKVSSPVTFCTKLTTFVGKIDERLAEKQAKADENKDKETKKIEAKRTDNDAKLAEKRA